MIRYVLSLLLILSFSNSYGGDYDCVSSYVDQKIILAFNDGDIHQVEFHKNEFDIVTASYGSFRGRVIYQNIEIYCLDYRAEIFLYKGKESPVGPYMHHFEVFLPYEIEDGESEAMVDLRWGYFYDPPPKVFLR